jgi:hypothetical protein
VHATRIVRAFLDTSPKHKISAGACIGFFSQACIYQDHVGYRQESMAGFKQMLPWLKTAKDVISTSIYKTDLVFSKHR